MTQVPVNPPPWGPRRDPHFEATHAWEGYGHHEQITAPEAAVRGWYFRPTWYDRLRPDTRRCRIHGEVMFAELVLSENDLDIMYTDQLSGMATGYAHRSPTETAPPLEAVALDADTELSADTELVAEGMLP